MIRTALARKGRRHPQVKKCCSGSRVTAAKADVESSSPIGAPVCGKLPKNDLYRSGACSTARTTAPPISPPYGQALQNAKNDEEDGRPQADRPISRKQPNQRSSGTHADKTQHQHPLASDAVSKMPEHHGADRTGEETGRESRE